MKEPTYKEWLNKYFHPPVLKNMYKSNKQGDYREYSEEELKRRYKLAYKKQ